MHRFIRAVTALLLTALTVRSADAQAPAAARWYRGNTHAHTIESDGDSPALDVARWYRERGYQFVVISDHEKVTDVAPLNAQLAAPGEFVVLRGEEVTQRVVDATHPDGRRQAHLIAIGVSSVVLPLGENGIATGTVSDAYARDITAIHDAGGIAQVNHPNYRWSIRVRDLMHLPDSTLYEVWNGHPGVNNRGGTDERGLVTPSAEALWDSLLTRGKLLWGVGSDDAHHYRADHTDDQDAARPGRAWVMVRADSLEPHAIQRALHEGRFYATTGIVLRDYDVDTRGITLTIERPAEPRSDARYRIQFIGRGGRVLAESHGLAARYRFTGRERYVRVKISDSNGRQAWGQPVRVESEKRKATGEK